MKQPRQPEADAFRGVIAAAVTPRRAGETSIDLASTLDLVDFLGSSGVDAIALLGSTGEFVHFALDDRRHMTAFAARRSRVPLMVNVSHSTLDGAVELANEAADSGVQGVLLMPPYYFHYSQEALRAFYLEFRRLTNGDPPVFLYNIPAFTNPLEIGTTLDLLETGLFAGIKDSSGSWEYLAALLHHATNKPYAVFAGHEHTFVRARLAGASGVISGVASAIPELIVALDAAIVAGNSNLVLKLDARLQEFVTRLAPFPWPAGVREVLNIRRLNPGAPAIRYDPKESEGLRDLVAWFEPWFDEVERECGKQPEKRRTGGR